MAQIEGEIKAQGFSSSGVTPLQPALSLNRYQSWLKKNFHGDMAYLKDHLPMKLDPQQLVPNAVTAIVVSHDYFPQVPGAQDFPLPASQVALYAQGTDYHYWFKAKLQDLAARLTKLFPEQVFFPATDSAPILERDLAYRAGLGWVGKNTCLIHKTQGSLFFIGEILTSLKTEATPQVSPDHCGTCRRCIDACPTAALNEDRELDARRCISYWTIESRELPPQELRQQFAGWLFGCDICQTVCPWNEKVFGTELQQRSIKHATDPQLISELRLILTTSNKQLDRLLASTPLSRAGGRGLKRNAMVVAANHSITELVPEIKAFLSHPKLSDLAEWTLAVLARNA